jgi:glucosylceramidase
MKVSWALLVSTVASDTFVQVIQTAEKTDDRLTRKPDVPVVVGARNAPAIVIDQSEFRQTIDGFGGAITDAVASVWSQLGAELQQQVVELLWGPTGNQLNQGRLTIGATDFSAAMYSFAESHEDYDMTNFTLKHDDESGFIELAQKAQAASPHLEWISSPWSAPAWLKRNSDMRNSYSPGLVQTDRAQTAYALYLSKYFTEMKKRDIRVTRMTIQNEPHVKGQFAATYPSMGFTPEQERDYLRDYLGPKLREDHPDIKIFINDDQKTNGGNPMMTEYVSVIMQDAQAAKFVDGVAFHWYGDNLNNYDALQQVHNEYPDLPLLATEATLMAPAAQFIGTTPWKEAQKYAFDIIGDLNAWTTGWIEWNLLLDSTGGPTCIGPSQTEICTPDIGHCDAPILANIEKQSIQVRDVYWFMGHFSRFIPRGSKVVKTVADSTLDLQSVAVITPSNELVVIVLNMNNDGPVQYDLQLQPGQHAELTIPAHGIQTLKVGLSAPQFV